MIACVDDSQHGPYGSDNIDPGLVVVNEVVNTPGGAIIYAIQIFPGKRTHSEKTQIIAMNYSSYIFRSLKNTSLVSR